MDQFSPFYGKNKCFFLKTSSDKLKFKTEKKKGNNLMSRLEPLWHVDSEKLTKNGIFRYFCKTSFFEWIVIKLSLMCSTTRRFSRQGSNKNTLFVNDISDYSNLFFIGKKWNFFMRFNPLCSGQLLTHIAKWQSRQVCCLVVYLLT
jgi:hypothetical protein